MRILWITNKWLLPPFDGARKATISLLKKEYTSHNEITLLCMTEEREISSQQIQALKKITHIQDIVAIRSLKVKKWIMLPYFIIAPFIPLTMLRFYKSRKVVKNMLRSRQFDAIVFDGLHSAICFSSFGLFKKPSVGRVFYRAHNVEHSLWRQMTKIKNSFLAKCIFAFQTYLVKRFERSLLKRCDEIFPVSNEDEKALHKLQSAPSTTVPIGTLFQNLPTKEVGTGLKILFVARLDWYPNRQGLEWFLEFVWPFLKVKNASLTLCSSGNDKWLESKIVGDKKISLLRSIPDLSPIYSSHHVLINPIFIGSGTRVKAIEAAAHALPCLTTRLGIEGLPLTSDVNCLVYEKPQEWINALNHLQISTYETFGKSAYDSLKPLYEEGVCADQLWGKILKTRNDISSFNCL